MNKEKIIDAICKKVYPLSQECKSELHDLTTVLSVNKKEIIIKEGDTNTKMYFILSGMLRAFYLKDGNDITDWFTYENDFVCSIQNFFEDTPSQHYIGAIEESQLLAITKANVFYLSQKYREFEQLGNFSTTQTMVRLQKRIVSMQFETAQQKYLNLLKERPGIDLRVPLIHIASYLGIKNETLSRIRKQKVKN